MTKRIVDTPFSRGSLAFILAVVAGLAADAWGQESIRPSSTGALAAAARKGPEISSTYNIKMGPVTFDATGNLEIEFNDNVGLSEQNRESDVILRPTLRVDSLWRVSQLNTLHFAFGIGVAKYLDHSDLDSRSILLDPGSEISFDIYIGGNLRLNLHDRFAIIQNPTDEPNLNSSARFDRFQNSAGITAFWDLNDLKFVLGYDHFDYRSLGSDFDYLSRREEQFMASASLQLSDAVVTGLDLSAALINYVEDFNNDGSTWSAGPFLEMTLSPYTKLRASGGYQGMSFDSNGLSGDHSDYSGWFANVVLAQRLNQYWSHSLSIGHEARLGLSVNYAEYTFARYLAQWRINSRMNAGFEAFVEQANESGSATDQGSEKAFRWGIGANVSWRLGTHLTLGLKYRFVDKDSDQPLRSYYQNVGVAAVGYDF